MRDFPAFALFIYLVVVSALLIYGATKWTATEERDSFHADLASCFFAVGGGDKERGVTIPQPQTTTPKCIAIFKEYFKQGGPYWKDIQTAVEDAKRVLQHEGNYAQMVIFDVDDTCLSNVPVFVSTDFVTPSMADWTEWMLSADLPAIPTALEFYKDLIAQGYAITFLTGRREVIRNITIANLFNKGFGKQCEDFPASVGELCYVDLIMKKDDDERDFAAFKSEERAKLKAAGFDLVASVGSQWSDLLGTDTPPTLIKMPNPMYYIP